MTIELEKLIKCPVWVSWVDSNGSGGWLRPGSLGTNLDCVTLGFLVWENDLAIEVTASVSATGFANDSIMIPKCSITKICEVDWL